MNLSTKIRPQNPGGFSKRQREPYTQKTIAI